MATTAVEREIPCIQQNRRKMKSLSKLHFNHHHQQQNLMKGLRLNSHDVFSPNFNEITKQRADKVVKCLREFGLAVIDRFLGVAPSRLIRHEVESLSHNAIDGQTITDPPATKRYRSDRIRWVHGNEAGGKSVGHLLKCLDSLIRCVDEKLDEYLIEGRTQAMVACYPGNGSGYVRHVDNPYKDGRVLTCIYYLNENWVQQDGGALRIYANGSSRLATVEPVIDRLLIFWSDNRSPHEVTPTVKPRYAVTVWYFDRTERDEALKRLNDTTSLASTNHISLTKSRSNHNCNNNNILKSAEGIACDETMDTSDDEEINVVDDDTEEYRQRAVSFNESATPFVSSDYVATSPILSIDTSADRSCMSTNRKVLSPRNSNKPNRN